MGMRTVLIPLSPSSSIMALTCISQTILQTWTTGLADVYWNADRDRSTSIGKSEFPCSMESVSPWNSANPATRRWSCHTTSCTCLLSSNSNFTSTSERRRANLARASCLHRRINLDMNKQIQTDVWYVTQKWMYEVCSKSIRIGIVVVVHWVGCVCSQSWHVHTCLSNSRLNLQVAAFTQLAMVGRGSNTCVYVIAIFMMCKSTELRICIKFCFKIGKTATETYQLLQQADGKDAMGCTQVFDWFCRFKEGHHVWIKYIH